MLRLKSKIKEMEKTLEDQRLDNTLAVGAMLYLAHKLSNAEKNSPAWLTEAIDASKKHHALIIRDALEEEENDSV